MFIENNCIMGWQISSLPEWATRYWHVTHYYNPDNFFQFDVNIFSNVLSINVLAVHSENPVDPSIVSDLPRIDPNWPYLESYDVQIENKPALQNGNLTWCVR